LTAQQQLIYTFTVQSSVLRSGNYIAQEVVNRLHRASFYRIHRQLHVAHWWHRERMRENLAAQI